MSPSPSPISRKRPAPIVKRSAHVSPLRSLSPTTASRSFSSNCPVAKFLERNPDGGMHHLCFEVEDIIAARDQLKAKGARVLGDGNPKIGAHGKPVLFLHPKDFAGTLIEIEQV
jgi:methylmalonyl-CoA epimerase